MKKSKKLTNKEKIELQEFTQSKGSDSKEARRVLAILMLNKELSLPIISELAGFEEKYIYKLRKKFFEKGIKALETKRKKPRALLTKNQRKEIIHAIKTTTPRDYGFEWDYWTTSILTQLIKEQYNVQYKSKTSLYIIFKEARFTYHKPDKQYKARNQQAIDTWKKETLPKIQQFLNDDHTVVLTEDEMMLSTQTTTQKIWLEAGQFPKIDIAVNRKVRCIYGFLDVGTGKEYAFKASGANSEETIKALKKIQSSFLTKKIVIIWDNAGWHKSKVIREFLRSKKNKFHLINFPTYSPELNPQEHVWKTGRSHVTHNKFIKNIDVATDEFVEYLNNSLFEYSFVGLDRA